MLCLATVLKLAVCKQLIDTEAYQLVFCILDAL